MREPDVCWVDGALRSRASAALPATDSAYQQGRGCYTTARICTGRARFAGRHAERLVRDARRLGIGEVDPRDVLRALDETGRAAFGATADARDGAVRVQASRDADGRVHLCAIPRELGPEPASWRACTAPFPHEGPMPWSGAKVTNHLLFALAAEHARDAGLDEALLLDRDGVLVEGSRASLVAVGADDLPVVPDPARGGVAGVGLEVLRARVREIRVRDVGDSELHQLRELIAVNAIRGPRAIVELDGRAIGAGVPGPWAQRLSVLFERCEQERAE